eukprot:4003815-Amphidinium_carterae.1
MEQSAVMTGTIHPIGVITQDLADLSRSLYFLLAQAESAASREGVDHLARCSWSARLCCLEGAKAALRA